VNNFRVAGDNLFGAVVHSRRLNLHLTLDKVGKMAGNMSKGYMSGIENGKVAPPTMKFIVQLARTLKLPLNPLALRAWVQKAPAVVQRTLEYQTFRKLVEQIEIYKP
jgi:transcriptional regulator with XRE-family HTH domain